MVTLGLALIVFSLISLWVCLPGRSRTKQWFLRGGADTVATILIVSCLGLGLVILVAGVAQI